MRTNFAGKLSMFAAAALLSALTSPVLRAEPAAPAQSATAPQAPAAAQSPAKVVNQLLSVVEHELVPLAEAMPADKYDFAPTMGQFKGVSNFGDQLRHVIHANYFLFGDGASMKATVPPADQLKTKEQIVQALKDSFTFAHQAADTLTGETALETVKPADGVDTRSGVMLFAIIHMNDHYGQLVEYLRMNGIIPPASRH